MSSLNGSKPPASREIVLRRTYTCTCGHESELPPEGPCVWTCECGEEKRWP